MYMINTHTHIDSHHRRLSHHPYHPDHGTHMDNQLDKIAFLPTTKQAENFKQNILAKCNNFRTYTGVVENLLEFQVDDKAKFYEIADMDRLIFLGAYQADPVEQQVSGKNSTKKSKKVSNFGFVFSYAQHSRHYSWWLCLAR